LGALCSALCLLGARPGGAPLPLPVCPLLGPALLWLCCCACRRRARSAGLPSGLRVQLLLGPSARGLAARLLSFLPSCGELDASASPTAYPNRTTQPMWRSGAYNELPTPAYVAALAPLAKKRALAQMRLSGAPIQTICSAVLVRCPTRSGSALAAAQRRWTPSSMCV
jgi:hypothetical protein